ncbi:lipid transferase CIDEA [Chaetodon auriga]|uniref:lipid transferase CIDEA n=1 Tax=Chaetodon auriga TaxID=39042 RepID=UPI004032B85B
MKNLNLHWLQLSVSAVQSSISEQIVASARPRSFKVCTSSRRRRRGLEASSLDELLEQAARVFVLSCHFLILVLEEDGTVVDSEEFFQSLPSNAALMVLEKGEMWTQNRVLPGSRQSKRNGIAKLTFDLYKLHPQDFLCCFAVKATLHEVYVLSYDFRWSRMKHVLNWLLCCLTCLIRLTGQMLLQTSSSLLQLCGDDDC